MSAMYRLSYDRGAIEGGQNKYQPFLHPKIFILKIKQASFFYLNRLWPTWFSQLNFVIVSFCLTLKIFLGFVEPQIDGKTKNSTQYSNFWVLFS